MKYLNILFILLILPPICGCAKTNSTVKESAGKSSAIEIETVKTPAQEISVQTVQPITRGKIDVQDACVCREVINRVPTGASSKFEASVEKICFYTNVVGAERPVNIEHVWIWKGKEMSRVRLKINSARWRTFSSKKINPSWTGNWTVKAFDQEGNELASVDFIVE